MKELEMKKYLVDTNILLRAILEDHKTQSPRAQRFLEKIKSSQKYQCYTTPWVIAEIIWTLRSLYRYTRKDVVKIVEGIINTPNLKVLQERLVAEVIVLFEEKGVDFIDAVNCLICSGEEFDGVVSFDEDFDKLGMKRVQPK